MASHRSMMRRRVYGPAEPWSPSPPKRIRHSASIPSACQKEIGLNPKSGGSNQFHSHLTSWPPRKTNSTIPTIASGAIISNRLPLFMLMLGSSPFPEFVVNVLQSLAQMQHRIALPRQQRIHAHPGLGSHLLEAASFQLVGDEHLTLLLRQLLERQLELIEKHAPRVKRLRSGVGR